MDREKQVLKPCTNLTIPRTPTSMVPSCLVREIKAFSGQNMTTMCAGSKTSGKSDMSMTNLFIPGTHIKPAASRLLTRVAEMGGPSVLGKGGQPWQGLDVCKGCPLFKYEGV